MPPSADEIRPAGLEDAAVLAAFMTLLRYPTTTAQMERRLSWILPDPEYYTVVSERAGSVVGMAAATMGRFYERDGRYGRLLALAVADEMHGTGVGRALMGAVETWVVERGGTEVTLNSSHFRTGARRFYEHLGYAATGLRFVKRFEG